MRGEDILIVRVCWQGGFFFGIWDWHFWLSLGWVWEGGGVSVIQN
jgi:hypothetical protein